MTDKVQKIRNEVERLRDELIQEKKKGFGSDVDDACILELQNVFTYIDSLQEEPASENLEQAAKQYEEDAVFYAGRNISDFFKAGAKWQKTKDESTTEDLGEYINELSKQFPEVSFAKLSRIAVRVAKWQKEQDQSTIELAEDHAMIAGMEKMKQQMMKEPNLSGYVARDEDGNLHIFEVEPIRLEEKHRWWDRDYSCHIIDNNAFPALRWEDEPICVKLVIIKED